MVAQAVRCAVTNDLGESLARRASPAPLRDPIIGLRASIAIAVTQDWHLGGYNNSGSQTMKGIKD